jgi:hypothetical protein
MDKLWDALRQAPYPGQDSNLQPDRYEREDKVGFVDFLAFSVAFDRVRCVLARSFLVRNWCGSFAIETYI